MEKTSFSKIEKVIIYIISKLPNDVTRTQLVKLLYLIDLFSFKQTKSSITNLTYISYHYGPYSPQIKKALDTLNDFEIQEDLNTSVDGNTFYLYSLGTHPRLKDSPDKLLKSGEKEIINEILENYGHKSLKCLLEIVYETKAYKNTPLGKEISFI